MTQTTLSSSPMSRSAGLSSVLHSPAFVTLWLSEAISLVGDRILMVALITLVYETTRSSTSVGLLAMIKAIPALVIGTLAGVFVDRWSRKWIMVLSNLFQGLLVLSIPWLDSLPLLFGIYFGMSVISQFFIPARSAAIPNLVPPEALVTANALFAMVFVGALAVGPALGGVITNALGLDAAFYIDGLTFLVPAVAVCFLSIPQAAPQAQNHGLAMDWRAGISLAWRRLDLRLGLLLVSVVALLIASLSTLGVMLAREQLGGTAADFGWLMSAMGGGMLVGAVSGIRLARRGARISLAALGACLAGVGMSGMALAPSIPFAQAGACLLGFGFTWVQVNVQTLLQNVEDEMRGRLQGLSQSLMGSVLFLAAGLAGMLSARFGVTPVLLAAALLALATGVLTLFASRQIHLQPAPYSAD